ncbi:MAG TPA: patatin-like protein [Symbiobacteriaceae bacterium]|nr:patatin-like protein [Symbiobacteriaceae bacterium]
MAQDRAFQLRVGLVLYGGSSLAVYMSGMTQELLAAVRAAQARKVLGRGSLSLVLQDWAAAEVAGNPYCGLLEQANIDLIIDVIAGTSAGGLNGIMLAKALAVGAPELGTLTDGMWRDKADMEPLAKFDRDPKSVLSGDYLYSEMLSVMAAIGDAGRPELAELVKVLDLFITATDVHGHTWTRWDRFNQKLQGQSHKYLFHLRKRTRQWGDLRGYDCNDFDAPDADRQIHVDTLLAKIGRATSAFPGVFPPVKISPVDARKAGVGVLNDLGPASRDGVWFSDGGMLVNAPFEPVIDTICERGANQPVKRVLVFLEPDPVTDVEIAQTEPSMVETAAAAVTLPMQQDIFDKLERLGKENQRRQRLLELMKGLDSAVAGGVPGQGQPAEVVEAFSQAAAASLGEVSNAETRTYLQMRLNRLKQVLRDALRRALESLSLEGRLLDDALALLEQRLMSPAAERMLELYDAEYHSRRLHYLLARVHEHCAPGAVLRDGEATGRLLGQLWGALEDWNNLIWVLAHAGRLGAQPKRWQSLCESLDVAMVRFVEGVKAGSAPEDAAGAVVQAIRRYAEAVHAATADDISHAFAEAEIALELRCEGGAGLKASVLRQAFDEFPALDKLLFPIEISSGRGVWGEIGLYGFRPNAAQSWVQKSTADKLSGEALGHFAAFLDARWRENDIMWGRLDAAELLFRMVARESGLIVTPDEALPANVDACLMNRRRQILGAYPGLIDLRRLRALTHRRAVPSVLPAPPTLSVGERLTGAWQFATRGQVAASLMPPGPGPAPFSIDQVPADVLREYLMRHYKVGEEGIDSLPAGRLAGELLLMLDNMVKALGKPAPSAFMGKVHQMVVGIMKPLSWVARLVLMPQKGLMGLVQTNLAPLMTLVGFVLLVLWAVGAVTLAGGGLVVLAALFAPVLVDVLFRPSAIKLLLLGAPALLTGLAALAPHLSGLAWGKALWDLAARWTALARIWAPFAAAFAAGLLAWWSNWNWRRSVRKMKQGAGG